MDSGAVAVEVKPSPPKPLKRAGPPKPDEWQRWLEYALTLLLTLYTDNLIRPITDITPEERNTVADMNSSFVDEFSQPLSRILARSALNARYGRNVVDSYDWLALIIAAWGYHRDMAQVRARRAYALRQRKNSPQLTIAPSPTTGAPQPDVQFDPTTAQGGDVSDGGESLAFDGIAVPPGAALV